MSYLWRFLQYIEHRHTGERPEDNGIANKNIEDPAVAGIDSNVVFNSEAPAPPLVSDSKGPVPPFGSLVIDDNVVNLPPPVQSLEKPIDSILGRGEVELVDDGKTFEDHSNLETETEKQGSRDDVKTVEKQPISETEKQDSAEIETDLEPDPDVNTFEAEEEVKEEKEDVKAALDSDLEDFKTETAQQKSRPNDVINVEDDWGDFEEAFGDEQEVAEVEVIGGGENHDDLLHADSDEEVGDRDGLVKSIEMR